MILLMMLLWSMLLSQVQIRKLYQPQLFPNASVLPIFDEFFGPIGKRFFAASFFLLWSSVQGPEDRLRSWLWTKYLAQWGVAPARETLSRLRMAGKKYPPSAGWWLRIALYPLYLDGMCWYKGWHHDHFNAYIMPVKFIDVKSQRSSVHFRCISIWAQELERRRKLMCHLLIRRFFSVLKIL